MHNSSSKERARFERRNSPVHFSPVSVGDKRAQRGLWEGPGRPRMADQNGGARGVPLSGKAVFDEDLYGGDMTGYAAVAADMDDAEEVDEREAAVAR